MLFRQELVTSAYVAPLKKKPGAAAVPFVVIAATHHPEANGEIHCSLRRHRQLVPIPLKAAISSSGS
jgi:hypothetical protein